MFGFIFGLMFGFVAGWVLKNPITEVAVRKTMTGFVRWVESL